MVKVKSGGGSVFDACFYNNVDMREAPVVDDYYIMLN